jgi:dipeptidyl aminopeptidase/acylaminoacyl peptidase
MTTNTDRVLHMSIAVAIAAGLATPARAQTKSPVPPSDYQQWETLAIQPRATSTGPLSPDGRFLVYGIIRQNRDNELRVVDIQGGKTTVLAFGEQPSFSADSRWLAYAIGVAEAEEEKLQKARKPVRRKVGILNLVSGEKTTMADIETFAFSADGRALAMRAYAPEAPRPQGGDPAPPTEDTEERDRPGSALIVRSLAANIDTTFGNVTEFAWQTKGPLLAFTLGVEGRRGNGLQLYNPSAGSLRVLDSGEAAYSNISWRKDADDLAVLRSKADAAREGATYVGLAWRGLEGGDGERQTLDPTAPGVLSADRRIVSYRRPEWSKDGRTVFVGIAEWFESAGGAKPADADEAAGVDVWHWKDVDVMPLQKKRAATDRQRNLLAAWHVDRGALVPLARTLTEDVRPLEGSAKALVIDRGPYAMERSIGRRHADLALIDTTTGARTPVKEHVEDRYIQASPDGRFVLYLLDDHYWIYDIESATHRNLTRSVATSFVDKASDATVAQKPAFGVGGWTTDSATVLLYDEYDVWEVATGRTSAMRLTDGASEQVRHRLVSLVPEERVVDRGKTVYFSVFGEWTKRSGYARLAAGANRPERSVWLDKRVRVLVKARDGDVFAYVVEAFDDSPDYMVSGPALSDARPVTATNPQQQKYAWGRAELVEYKNARGERTLGALFYPAGYEAGKRYPMVVYMYELLSDTLHNYISPSARAPYNAGVFTSQGYFFFAPDIVFRPREPGVSVVEAVVPGVRTVLQKAAVDPARVGIVGHSWGGFDTVYLATHTDVFAAAIAGAPITNLVSNYGNHHWSQGIAETDHIETGQQRMEVPLWEDLPAYIRNSAVFRAHTMKTPLLVAFGENDGTVFWHQGVELYNIARRAGRPVVLLTYAAEDHGLRKRVNQIDYQQRILQWFGHYLKGEPAPAWIERGVPALERERELKKAKPAPAKPTTSP